MSPGRLSSSRTCLCPSPFQGLALFLPRARLRALAPSPLHAFTTLRAPLARFGSEYHYVHSSIAGSRWFALKQPQWDYKHLPLAIRRLVAETNLSLLEFATLPIVLPATNRLTRYLSGSAARNLLCDRQLLGALPLEMYNLTSEAVHAALGRGSNLTEQQLLARLDSRGWSVDVHAHGERECVNV